MGGSLMTLFSFSSLLTIVSVEFGSFFFWIPSPACLGEMDGREDTRIEMGKIGTYGVCFSSMGFWCCHAPPRLGAKGEGDLDL